MELNKAHELTSGHRMMDTDVCEAGRVLSAEVKRLQANSEGRHAVVAEIKRRAMEIALDYPNLTIADPLEQLWAIGESYKGVLAALEDERKWAAYLRCCAFSGEIPSSREEFNANEQYLRMIKESQNGPQSTDAATTSKSEAESTTTPPPHETP